MSRRGLDDPHRQTIRIDPVEDPCAACQLVLPLLDGSIADGRASLAAVETVLAFGAGQWLGLELLKGASRRPRELIVDDLPALSGGSAVEPQSPSAGRR
jgi:hypothetical protein